MIEPLRASLIAFAIAVLTSGSAGPGTSPDRFEFTQVHMGMPVRVVLYAPNGLHAESAARAAFARIAELDAMLSDYRPDSELSRLSQNSQRWVPVSSELYRVLSAACEIAGATAGAFDPTVGPLTALWRAARRDRRLPSADAVASARALVSWRFIEFDADRQSVRLARAGMRLDLGGIAKGFVLQQAFETIERAGFPIAMLEAGGDIIVGAAPPGKAGWRIDVPYGGADFQARARSLARAAIATSGPTMQSVEIDGSRYSHVIDPRTGFPLTASRTVGVIAREGLWADGLATALGVIEIERAAAVLRQFPAVVAATWH